MEDPWKYIGFTVAGIAAFVTADLTGPFIAEFAGLEDWAGEYVAAGSTGLVLGFLIDDMLPVYIDNVRGGSGGNGDLGGGGDMDDGDFDF